MNRIDTIVLGGGQAGLAVSRCLTDLDVDHVVLERGHVAERWRSERWDSLRLLTPNWMTRLPGFRYDGPDPDGYMGAAEVADFFRRYASSFDAPVREHTTVLRLRSDDDGLVVDTDDGCWHADHVVIATGWCDRPAVPAAARQLSPRIHQVVPTHYRRPDDLPPGGVLVVGASASGVQLADELHASGRDVTIAVGRHSRLPRSYRGMDIFWWLDLIGAFDRTIDEVADPVAARNDPSFQLVGRPDRITLDLAHLLANGVRLAGRLRHIDGTHASFGTDLEATLADADRRMAGMLGRIDDGIARLGLDREVLQPEPLPVVRADQTPDELDLHAAGITSVVWATGHRRDHGWIELPILDDGGEIRQRRGVTPVHGVYVLGQRFQYHRNSNFIDGVGRDAQYVAAHIARSRRTTSSCAALRSEQE